MFHSDFNQNKGLALLFSPVPYLFPFPAGKRAGQEKTAVRCQAAGNSARWQTACEKRKIRDGHAVSVPLCVSGYTEHSPLRRGVPLVR